MAKQLLYWFKTDNSKLDPKAVKVKNQWFNSHPKEMLQVIVNAIQANPNLFVGPHEQDYLRALHELWMAYQQYATAPSTDLDSVPVEK